MMFTENINKSQHRLFISSVSLSRPDINSFISFITDVKVRFYDTEWEAYAEASYVHHREGLSVIIPSYKNTDVGMHFFAFSFSKVIKS